MDTTTKTRPLTFGELHLMFERFQIMLEDKDPRNIKHSIENFIKGENFRRNLFPENKIEEAVEESVDMIQNFSKGYIKCIEDLHKWNEGLGKPDIAVHNRLVTLERNMNNKVKELLS